MWLPSACTLTRARGLNPQPKYVSSLEIESEAFWSMEGTMLQTTEQHWPGLEVCLYDGGVLTYQLGTVFVIFHGL